MGLCDPTGLRLGGFELTGDAAPEPPPEERAYLMAKTLNQAVRSGVA